MTHTQQKSPNLWLVIAAAAAILLITIGMRMTMGLFVRPVVDSTELSIQEFSLIIAVFQLMWGLSQPLSGALADRFGAHMVIAGGLVVAAVAFIGIGVIPSLILVAVLWGVAVLAAQGTQISINVLTLRAPGGAQILSTIQASRFYGNALTPLVFLPIYGAAGAWVFAVAAAVLLAMSAVTAAGAGGVRRNSLRQP